MSVVRLPILIGTKARSPPMGGPPAAAPSRPRAGRSSDLRVAEVRPRRTSRSQKNARSSYRTKLPGSPFKYENRSRAKPRIAVRPDAA